MSKDANDISKDWEIRERRGDLSTAHPDAEKARKGRVILVRDILDKTGESEEMLGEDMTLQFAGPKTLIADYEDEDGLHRSVVNLDRFDYVEFWVRPSEGE